MNVFITIVGRKDDEAREFGLLTYALNHFNSRSARQSQIDQGDIWLADVELSDSFDTVSSFPDKQESWGKPQQSDEALAYNMMIFNGQDSDRIDGRDSSRFGY
jgi:hypothetical protein